MAMAHGIEGRFPFLDHHLYEFAASLPTGSRLRGLKEKEILRRWASRILPLRIKERRKQPYRAPDATTFFGPGSPEWVGDALSSDALKKVGIFSPTAVAGLIRRCGAGFVTGFRENQALVGVLSTQLWHRKFIETQYSVQPLAVSAADVVLSETIHALS